jgi:uncharacterized membrane protein
MSGAVALIEPVVCHFAHRVHDWVWGFLEKEPAYVTVAATNSTLAAV